MRNTLVKSLLHRTGKRFEIDFPDANNPLYAVSHMPEFNAKRYDLDGFLMPVFHFSLPFAGHKKTIFHPNFRIRMTHYFDYGMTKALEKLRADGTEIVSFEQAFVLFMHHINPSDYHGTSVDMDNIETKRVIDTLHASIIQSDFCGHISTRYMSQKTDGEPYTEMYVSCEEDNLKLQQLIAQKPNPLGMPFLPTRNTLVFQG
jgi:hypothetical protein